MKEDKGAEDDTPGTIPRPEAESGLAAEEDTVRFSLSPSSILSELERIPYLLVLKGELAGHVFPLEKTEHVLGRASDADISIPDRGVSRRHARLVRSGGKVILWDLGSTNGTYVVGRGIVGENIPFALDEGEQFGVGPVALFKLGFASLNR